MSWTGHVARIEAMRNAYKNFSRKTWREKTTLNIWG